MSTKNSISNTVNSTPKTRDAPSYPSIKPLDRKVYICQIDLNPTYKRMIDGLENKE